MMRKLGVFVGLALAALAGSAHAQDGMGGVDPMAPPVTDDTNMATTSAVAGGVPPQLVRRSVQGAAGQLMVRAIVHANLSKGAVFKPFSIAPDVFYGVNDKLQVGLLHNGPMGWQTSPNNFLGGPGLCLAGKDNGCEKVYNNVGFDALYRLLEGETEISGHGSLYLMSLDPMALGVALGVAGKAHLSDQLAIWFDPQLYIGITERDTFNKDGLYIPAELQFQAQDQLALLLFTGLTAPFDGFGDLFMIPVGVGGFYNVNEMIDVGARFSFDNLLGKNSSADVRSLALLVNVRP